MPVSMTNLGCHSHQDTAKEVTVALRCLSTSTETLAIGLLFQDRGVCAGTTVNPF